MNFKLKMGLAFFLGTMLSSLHAEEHELKITYADTYTVKDTGDWQVSIKRYLSWNYADVAIQPKNGKTFSLMLYFESDMPALGKSTEFDTPEKMKKRVLDSSKRYLPGIVEKTIEIEEITNKGWYGFKTQFTDADLAGKPIPPGEFLYISRGMLRLAEHSAVGFSLMTNDLKSDETKKIMDYIYGFAKEKKATPPKEGQ